MRYLERSEKILELLSGVKYLSYDQLLTVDDKSYQGVNLFTMGPKSIKNDELVGLYLDVVPRKSKL